MLAGRAGTAVGREHDEVATGAGPRVRGVRDVQVIVVVSGEAAGGGARARQLRDGLVEVGVGVEGGAPEVLAVGRVGAAAVALLGPVVHDGDAAGEDDVGEGVLEQLGVGLGVEPARVVVVVEEGAEGRGVRELGVDRVVHVDDGLARARLLVEGVHGVVDGVVEEARHGARVAGEVVGVPVEDLADGVHARRGRERRPELLLDVLHRVDADAVERVLGDEPRDPLLVEGADLLARRVDVGQSGDPARLDAVLVRVVDVALRVVRALLVQRLWLVVADGREAHVVGHYVHHDVYALSGSVSLTDQRENRKTK